MFRQKLKKILIALLIIMTIFCLFSNASYGAVESADDTGNSTSNDAELEIAQARNAIAAKAISFANDVASGTARTRYSTSYSARAATYNATDPQALYTFDCVGLVSYIVNRATGITNSRVASGNNGFVQPLSCNTSGIVDTTHFGYISSLDDLQPGDILISNKHVAIYVGGGYIVDYGSTVSRRTMSSAETDANHVWQKAARLISIDGAYTSTISGGSSLSNSTSSSTSIADGLDIVDLDEIASSFEYSGLASDVSVEKIDIFEWLFDSVSGFADYLIGIIMSAIRIPLVGITELLWSGISGMLSGLN